MIISVNWLKKFTDIDVSIQELTELIGSRLVEIEKVEDLAEKYKDVIVVKVVECGPVPDSDHLNLTKIDDGGKLQQVTRDENGLIQVVCGAPNVTTGMLAAWLPPESTVPETLGTKEPFVLGVRELRGFKSNGMLASAKELDLYDDHNGIVVVDKDAAPGTSFAELYELNDYLLDIENKSLTHRPDVFGIIGFAREVAGIQGKAFTTPAWLDNVNPNITSDRSVETPLVTIDDPALSDRFQAVVLSGVNEPATSPLEMQTYLARSGIRPISAVVDVTNYMLLLAGRPLHAFDYDKLLAVNNGKIDIHVRSGREGETLTLLNGRTIDISPDDIVVANGETAVSLAGAMGGADTEVDIHTKRILLESATFNLYKLRAVQMRHGIFSESITRLTKGIPAPLGAPVLVEAAKMMRQFAGAVVASDIVDAYPGMHDPIVVTLQASVVNETLGTKFSSSDIQDILHNVEFDVEVSGTDISITVPYWRNDIHIAEDIIEEVGRLSGFDLISPVLPSRDFTAVRPSDFDVLRAKIRGLLVRAGANEVLTYSFIHGDIMRKAGQNPDSAYRLTNSMSPDLQYYRQSIVPSLLTHIHPNIKAGFDHFALFEFNKFHSKRAGLTEENVPKECDGLGFVIASQKKAQAAAFYQAKRYLNYIANELGIEFVYETLEGKVDTDDSLLQPFEPKRSATVWDVKTHEFIGVVGEFKKSVQKALKLPDIIAGFEIFPTALQKVATDVASRYVPLSKYPGTSRDVTFQVASDMTYQKIYDAANIAQADVTIRVSVTPLDIYQPISGETKNITLRFTLGSYEKTLTSDEVRKIMAEVTENITTATKGKVI
ncbi:MAG: phenylalanine--tRNA ligase subunit beta [Candidatus Microsaccharimonas sossegonensis]|uniref:Phenylalanine--tRNA ligase beta subunit n=1 Tax=Candidatus Microsaccharimonas sossegonensis TaxID=2506948 RepID=A0A4Q0AIG2_9BACT|nr:MAG: phenylalanine--tRNA ligase subunit beta [Candidatus Microsaccharimonas sossegonensis]